MRRIRYWNSLSHTWLGLLFGLIFAVMGLTGALLNLAPELERWSYPATAWRVSCRGDVSLAGLEAGMQRTGQVIDRLYLSEEKDARVHVRTRLGKGEEYGHWVFDGCSGELIGPASLGWVDWVTDFHHNLLNGKTGRKVAGVFGVLLVVNALTALVLWLMTKPRWSHLLVWRSPAGGRALNYHLHRAVGLLALVFLVLEAGTGYFLAFPVTEAAEAGAPRAPRAKSKVRLLPLDAYLNAARGVRPQAKVREIRTGSPVAVYFWPEPGWAPNLQEQILLRRDDASVAGSGNKGGFQRMVARLHYSEWGGGWARYLAAALGVAPAFLFLTGFFIWWLPRAATAARKRERHRLRFALTAAGAAARSTTTS